MSSVTGNGQRSCVFTLAWGQPTPLLVRRAEVGLEHTETGPASAGSTSVSKRVMHWKIDMFLGTAESYCVFPI